MGEEMIKRSDYELCEDENSNLRKCLAWAGKHLTPQQRHELRGMIERTIQDGGVVEDGKESDWKYVKEIQSLCVKAAVALREAVETDDPVALIQSNWSARADDLAGKLMEFDPPSPEACLAEIRNCSAMA